MKKTDTKHGVRNRGTPTVAPRRELMFREGAGHLGTGFDTEAEWLRRVREDSPKFVPFLVKQCGVDFHGRILEIGGTAAWFSAELSKQPKVVEIIIADFSPMPSTDESAKLFRLLKAHEAKIARRILTSPRLDFAADHFDFVVCAGWLHRSLNMVAVLREVGRVLKPGGRFVAVREPVLPLVTWKSAARRQAKPALPGCTYTLADYREFFALAGLELATQRLNLAVGFKYYFDEVINGLTHARYAFLATKRSQA